MKVLDVCRYLKEQIRNRQELQLMLATRARMLTRKLDGMPHARSNNQLENIVVRLIELQGEIKIFCSILQEAELELEELFYQAYGEDYEVVELMSLRYCECLNFREIEDATGSNMNRIFYLHKKAMQKFLDKLDKQNFSAKD